MPPISQKSSTSTNESFDKTDIDPLINQKLFNKRYSVKRVLGAGSFGKVYLVFDEHTGIEYESKRLISLIYNLLNTLIFHIFIIIVRR